MTKKILAAIVVMLMITATTAQGRTPNARPRASDLGLKVGVLPAGPLDAITDIAGVEVGHTTIIRGDDVRTGVTAILPHPGNLFREKVPGAVFVGNAFGKLAGSTQLNELGPYREVLNNCGASQFADNVYQVNDSVSWIRGKHNLKFGGELRFLQFNVRRLTQSSGEFDFDPTETSLIGSGVML